MSLARRFGPHFSYSRTSFMVGIRPIRSMVVRRRKAASPISSVVMTPVPVFSRRKRSSSMVAASALLEGVLVGMATRLGISGLRSVRVTPFGHSAPDSTQASRMATSSGFRALPSSGMTPSSIGRRWIRSKSSLLPGLPGTTASAVSPPSISFS